MAATAGYVAGAAPTSCADLLTMNGQALPTAPQSFQQIALKPMAMEDSDETKFVKQWDSIDHSAGIVPAPTLAPPTQAGKWDALLAPGKSKELMQNLAAVFGQNQPPPAADIYGASYATQVFSPGAVFGLLKDASSFWDPLPSGNIERITVAANTRLIVCGDTHGQLEDVLWIFLKYGPPSASLRYLFNGDFVDRSMHSVEVTLLLLALKRDCREGLYITRGNHEDSEVNGRYGFKQECLDKFGNDSGSTLFLTFVSDIWCRLPIMAHVTDASNATGFVTVHGGIPQTQAQGPATLEQISKIQRGTPQLGGQGKPADAQLLFKLLWSDPAPDGETGQPAGAGRGDKFTAQDSAVFCQANQVQCIVRSHEVKPEGFELVHGGKCVTVFSASNYHGQGRNKGAVMIVDPKPTGLFPFGLGQFWAPPFSCLAQWMPLPPDQQAAYVQAWEAKFGINAPAPPPPAGAEVTPAGLTRTASAIADVSEAVEKAASQAPAADVKLEEKVLEYSYVQFANEIIVDSKENLYVEFKKMDTDQTGTVSKAQWLQVMQLICPLSGTVQGSTAITAQTLSDELYKSWALSEPVNYVAFLGRFQIARATADQGATSMARKPSTMSEIGSAREKMETVDFKTLIQSLDPDGDSTVTVKEFCEVMSSKYHIPQGQSAITFVKFGALLQKPQLNVDDVLTCLAGVDANIPPPHAYQNLVASITENLRQKGCDMCKAFKVWDKSCDGYLQADEIKNGLIELLTGAPRGDPNRIAKIEAAPPPPLQLAQYTGAGYRREDLELDPTMVQQMPPDKANMLLVQNQERWIGYVFQDALPNLPYFVKKGAAATPEPMSGFTSVMLAQAQPPPEAMQQAEIPKETQALVEAFMMYLQDTCKDVNNVNIMEFLRATLPREFLMRTQEVMLKDLLKRVFYARVSLKALLERRDPGATGNIPVGDFQACIKELNQTLQVEGHRPLPDSNIYSITQTAYDGCAAASVRTAQGDVLQMINYRKFVQSLRVVDTEAA